MELADFINLGHQEPLLPSLVIGGYAVAAHGYTRATFDVEILVRRRGLDLRDPRYEQLFLKYGTRELYDTFLRLRRTP